MEKGGSLPKKRAARTGSQIIRLRFDYALMELFNLRAAITIAIQWLDRSSQTSNSASGQFRPEPCRPLAASSAAETAMTINKWSDDAFLDQLRQEGDDLPTRH